VREIEKRSSGACPPDEVPRFFVEPIQAKGVITYLPRGSYRGCAIFATATASCGGRRGADCFWPDRQLFACEHWNVEADILCLAKGIASGLPLGAILGARRGHGLAERQPRKYLRGNPVSCRAALATLKLLEEGYTANAALRGEELRAGLVRLRADFPNVGDVRGWGS